jgi:hypothetical protein
LQVLLATTFSLGLSMHTQDQSIARIMYLVRGSMADVAQIAISEAESYLVAFGAEEAATERAVFTQRLRLEGPATPAMSDVLRALDGSGPSAAGQRLGAVT